jgi:hypothetical protein
LGDVLKPTGSTGGAAVQGGLMGASQPIIPGAAAAPAQAQPGKVLTGDLDSSLASLAENLSINKSASSSMK